MNRILGIPRKWIGTALVVLIMPALTIPWTLWIFRITYERDVNEKVRLIAERVRIHLSTSQWRSADQMLEPLRTELLADPTVQAVGFLSPPMFVRRSENIPIPQSREEVENMIRAASPSQVRNLIQIQTPGGILGWIYVDLSVDEVKKGELIQEAYELFVKERFLIIAERVKNNLYSVQWWNTDQMLQVLKAELLMDPSVQAVGFMGAPAFVLRNKEIPVPLSREEMGKLIRTQNPASFRSSYDIQTATGIAGSVYIDLSVDQLKKNFDRTEKGLMRSVWMLTAATTLILGIAGAAAFHLWRSSVRQKWLSEMEQQGKQAERGLTAAVLAHEIRNPLQALIFQISTLRRNSGNGERVGSIADTLESELQRIQRLVQDFLQHEKAQAFHVEPVSMIEAAKGLHSVVDELLRERGTRLVISANSDARVLCDQHALRQILMNLVLNAQQAMGTGGTITLRISKEEEYGLIDLADTGPGIPAEMQDKIFKPFTSSKKEGSGIGLALVKRFVDNFGGKISFDTAPGAGTTFHIRLPLDKPDKPAEKKDDSETPRLEKPTVL